MESEQQAPSPPMMTETEAVAKSPEPTVSLAVVGTTVDVHRQDEIIDAVQAYYEAQSIGADSVPAEVTVAATQQASVGESDPQNIQSERAVEVKDAPQLVVANKSVQLQESMQLAGPIAQSVTADEKANIPVAPSTKSGLQPPKKDKGCSRRSSLGKPVRRRHSVAGVPSRAGKCRTSNTNSKNVNNGDESSKHTQQTRGRTRSRVMRASTGGNTTPSYMRATRASSVSRERALKRKHDRMEHLSGMSKKCGFGGHTYKKRRQSMQNMKRSLTEPHSPRLSTSSRKRSSGSGALSSSEREAQQVAVEKKRADLLRAKNKRTMQVALAGVPVTGARPAKRLTKTNGPKLQTRNRPRARENTSTHSMRLRSRKNPTATGSGPLKLTRPKSPHLATSRRSSLSSVAPKASPFRSVAEIAHKFSSKTPARFHTKPKDHRPKANPEATTPKMLTQPVSPQFASSARAQLRAPPKSSTEIEDEQLSKIRSKPFKARPVNPRVMSSAGDVGVPRVQKKPPTRCQAPKLQTNARAASRVAQQPKQKSPVKTTTFRARCIGEGVQNTVPSSAPPAPLTEPKPFRLSTDIRAASRKVGDPAPKVTTKQFKARPLPLTTDEPILIKPKHTKKLTVPSTPKLSGASRHLAAQEKLAKKVAEKKLKEEQAREFKARPINDGVSQRFGAGHTVKPLTEPVPFNISSDPVGAKARFKERVHQQRREQENKRHFRARGIPHTHEAPYQPTKSSKPLAEVKNFVLASQRRAEKRAQFDVEAKKRRAAELAQRQRDLEAAEEEEEERIKEEMDRMQFKATKSREKVASFMKRPPKRVSLSSKQLVNPVSPQLATASRTGRALAH